jgi:AraC-like DNA-binding protein
MDPLSDVLRAVRLTGAYFYLVEATGRWAVAAKSAADLAPRILPDADHLIAYHIVTEGACWGGLNREPNVHLRAGDVLLFPQGDAHIMSCSPSEPNVASLESAPTRYPNTLCFGTGRLEVRLVCGFLGCDARPFNPLIAALPRVLHVPSGSGGWLAAFPEQVVRETREVRAGGDTMLTRMAELMFIEIVRQYLGALSTEHTGWLAGLRDPIVGAALAKLHERPSHDWSLAELAHEVATSRSVLAERFASTVGIPPMQYLARWRLQLAAELLARGGAKVSAIGAQVGYGSEAAFSRAFKRATGASPADWRRRRQPN